MKNAIITDGTSGIGLRVAKMLLEKGYRIYATYVGPEFKEKIDNFFPMNVNLASREEVHGFLQTVKSQCDTIDCIVCNAGMTICKSFTETTDSDWDKMMEVTVNSHYIIIRELFTLIPHDSRIIFNEFQMGLPSQANALSNGVTKAIVHALVSNLVKVFEGTGTTVNAIAPNFIEKSWQKDKPEQVKQKTDNETTIHRFTPVIEFVDAIRFCVDNSSINGSLIEVNLDYS